MTSLLSAGYYRVNYDTRNWLFLSKSLAADPSRFPSQNRAQFINDAFSLASSDRLDFAVALETLSFLQKERGPFVWQAAVRIITKMYDSVGPTEANPLFEVLVNIVQPEVLARFRRAMELSDGN